MATSGYLGAALLLVLLAWWLFKPRRTPAAPAKQLLPPPTYEPRVFKRGLAWHRLGMSAEGRADIERSLRLDSQNAYAYRNLGIYYFDQGDYQAALPLFKRAYRLGTAPPELAGYLMQTRQQLSLSYWRVHYSLRENY